MAADIWMYLIPVAALVGAGAGMWLARGRAGAMPPAVADELARAREQIVQAQQQAQADIAVLQRELQSRFDAALATHREESARLKKHLTEAFDEIEQLRHQARGAAPNPPDTGQGFAATMPLGDV